MNSFNTTPGRIPDAALLGGIPVDNLTLTGAVSRINEMISEYPKTRVAKLVATINVDFLVNAVSIFPGKTRNDELFRILRKADLVTADGAPLVALSKLVGLPIAQRVTGADLTPALCESAAANGHRVFILGSDEDTAALASAKLKAVYPELRISGVDSPYVHIEGTELMDAYDSDTRLVEKINASKPDILLIALGNPKQEIWFERNRYRLDVPVSIGIGGTLSFIAGTVKRAPGWMQSWGLEWIYRIMQEPGRLWKRYMEGLVKFGLIALPPMLSSIPGTRVSHLDRNSSVVFTRLLNGAGAVVCHAKLPVRLCVSNINELATYTENEPGLDMLLDFTNVKKADSRSFAELVRFIESPNTHAGNRIIVGMSRVIRRRMRINRVLCDEELESAGLDIGCVLSKNFPTGHGLSVWSSVYAPGDTREIYLCGNLSNKTIVDDPLAFHLPAGDFAPATIHLEGLQTIDNAGFSYLLNGLRLQGDAAIQIEAPSSRRFQEINNICGTTVDSRRRRPAQLPQISQGAFSPAG